MPFAVPQQAQFKTEQTPQRQGGGAAHQASDPWQRQPSRSQPQERGYRQPPPRQYYQQPQYGGRGQAPPRGYRGMEYAPQQYAATHPPRQYVQEPPVSYGASLIQSNGAPASGVYAQPGFQEYDPYDKGRYRDPLMYRGGY